MSFTLLYPLALLGALAVGIPVWLHLHRRFQGNVVRFSAMRFLQDEPLARRAPLRLKDPLLFALRVLAVLLLVLAFAWPYDRDDVSVPSLESRVYVLDNTLSHQADGEFETQRDRVAGEVDDAPPEAQVAVVELAAQPRVVASFDQDHASAAAAVRRLEASNERGSYAAALRLADTLLRGSIGEQRRLLIRSDDQANQLDELRNSPSFLEGVEVEASPSRLDARPNLAVARPRLRRLLAGERSLLELTLELYHQGDVKRADVEVTSNGRHVFQRSVELEGAPDRIALSMRWDDARGVAVRGEAKITGAPDALAADNRVYFALPPVRPGTVALVARSAFLEAAFAPEVLQEAWRARRDDPAEALASARRGRLADVLCLEAHYLQESSTAAALIARYLESDRGVLLFVDAAGQDVVESLHKLGFVLQPDPVVLSNPESVGYVQRDHPVFRPFRSSDFGRLNDVHFSRYFTLNCTTGAPLLFSTEGAPLLFEAGGNHRLLVAAFPVDRSATDWPLHPTFVPFLDLCLQRLRGEPTPPTEVTPREACVFHLRPDSSAKKFTLAGEDGELAQGTIDGRRVQLTAPAEPGVYVVEFDSEAVDSQWLAVNPPPAESELKYIDPHEIMKTIVQPGSSQPGTSPTGGRAPSIAEILRQQWWWVMLIGCLAMLLAENAWLLLRRRFA